MGCRHQCPGPHKQRTQGGRFSEIHDQKTASLPVHRRSSLSGGVAAARPISYPSQSAAIDITSCEKVSFVKYSRHFPLTATTATLYYYRESTNAFLRTQVVYKLDALRLPFSFLNRWNLGGEVALNKECRSVASPNLDGTGECDCRVKVADMHNSSACTEIRK